MIDVVFSSTLCRENQAEMDLMDNLVDKVNQELMVDLDSPELRVTLVIQDQRE